MTHHPDAQQRRKNRLNDFGDRKKKEDKKREKELKKGQLSGEEAERERRKLEHSQFFLAPIPMFEMFGEEGHPISKEGVPLSANQAGTNKMKGSCGGSAGKACLYFFAKGWQLRLTGIVLFTETELRHQ